MPVTSCTVPRTPAVTEPKVVTRPAFSQFDGSSGGQAGDAFFRLRRKRFPGGRSLRARASAKEAHRQEQAKAKLRRAGRRTTTNRQTGTCSTRTAADSALLALRWSAESVGIMCVALRSCLSSSVPCISCTFYFAFQVAAAPSAWLRTRGASHISFDWICPRDGFYSTYRVCDSEEPFSDSCSLRFGVLTSSTWHPASHAGG